MRAFLLDKMFCLFKNFNKKIDSETAIFHIEVEQGNYLLLDRRAGSTSFCLITCEADAKDRAASPRGCTRQRRRPLAGEPRG